MLTFLFIACTQGDQTFGAVNEVSGQDQGTAKLEYSPSEIIFSDVELDFLSSGTITITSVGDGALTIDKVDITNSADGAFYMDEASTENLSLQPEISRDFVVTVLMETSAVHIGELRIRSNDEDHRDVRIPLCAFPLGYEEELLCSNESTEDTEEDSGEQ